MDPNFHSRFSCIAVDEVLDQHGNVFFSLAQRRNLDGKHVQAIKEVPSKSAGSDRRLQVAIGGGNHAHVRVNRLVSAHTLELPLLQNPQQGNLGLRGKLTDLIEEDGASSATRSGPGAAAELP